MCGSTIERGIGRGAAGTADAKKADLTVTVTAIGMRVAAIGIPADTGMRTEKQREGAGEDVMTTTREGVAADLLIDVLAAQHTVGIGKQIGGIRAG